MATFFVDLDFTLLYSDNMGAIAIATNLNNDKIAQIRHINIHYHITRKALVNEILQLKYIQTAEMIMDILIKLLFIKIYNHHVKHMGLAIK